MLTAASRKREMLCTPEWRKDSQTKERVKSRAIGNGRRLPWNPHVDNKLHSLPYRRFIEKAINWQEGSLQSDCSTWHGTTTTACWLRLVREFTGNPEGGWVDLK